MTPRPSVRTIQIRPKVDRFRFRSATQSDVAWERSRFGGHQYRDAKELARLEWRLGEAGDPARLVSDFLAQWSLSLPNGAPVEPGSGPLSVAGAALFVSAAGCASMIGGAVA